MGIIVNIKYIFDLLLETGYLSVSFIWIVLWRLGVIGSDKRRKIILFLLIFSALLDVANQTTFSEILLGLFLLFWLFEMIYMFYKNVKIKDDIRGFRKSIK